MKLGTGRILSGLLAAALMTFAVPRSGQAERGGRALKADMDGWHEVPAISTTGTGEFEGRINRQRTEIEYTLTWENLQGGDVLFSHLHLAQPDVNGGVIVFLCGGGGKDPCPNAPSGSVSGTIAPADVQGPEGQGIAAEEFEELLRAVREGRVYANLHTEQFPTGEIRGQVK